MKKIEFEKLVNSGTGIRTVEEKVATSRAARMKFQERPLEQMNELPLPITNYIQQENKYIEIDTALDTDMPVRQKLAKEFAELPLAGIKKIDVLKQSTTFAKVAASTPPYAFAFLFDHANYSGRFYYLFNTGYGIYYKVPYIGDYFNDMISSLKIYSSKSLVELYLFQESNFEGRYQRVICPANKMKEVSYIGGYMNDRTSSVLLVRRRKGEYCIDLTSKFIPVIKDQVKKTSGIYSRGEPVVKWDLKGTPLVYIEIPVWIEISNWWDYEATIKYWIKPYLDSKGKLHASVTQYGWWVEGGMLTSCIVDEFKDKVAASVPTFNNKVAEFVQIAAAFTFKSLYLLPGDHQQGNTIPTCENPVDETGHTRDGVTLVLATE